MIKAFKELLIWQRSRSMVKGIYLLTQKFPKEELYVLTAQTRRSAISVPSNIAEGCGRKTQKDLSKFLDIAIASICELETQIYLAYDLFYLSKEDLHQIIDEITQIRKMIIGFQRKACSNDLN